MHKEPFNIEVAIIAATIVLLIIGSFSVVITVAYRRRRDLQLIETLALKSTFRQELLKAQNEIQEQTLTHVSREIHDNITQVLSFVKLNLAMTNGLPAADMEEKVEESRKLVAQAIGDLRDLSKSMSFDHILQLGLMKSVEIEVERISKSGIIGIALNSAGEPYNLGDQRELVLFRIFQEAINNSLKHSGAADIKIGLQYSEHLFTLTIADDGAGFLQDGSQNYGSGLKNMQNRAALIGAVATINSQPGKGCCITITIDPLLQQIYADGTYPNSSG